MTWRESLRPLSFLPFRLLLTGRLADSLAHAIAPIALAFAVLDLGGGPTELGIVLACRAIPTVVLILFGGVIADRLPRLLEEFERLEREKTGEKTFLERILSYFNG